MDLKLVESKLFLQSSQNLIMAFTELISRKYVDTRIRGGMRALQTLDSNSRKMLSSSGANSLLTIGKGAFSLLTNHLDESYIVLAYSWLDSYLSLIEEILYLNDPRSIGDNIQIKLGKILETGSVVELIHDAAKKRVKEKSGWGLKNRIADLNENYGVTVNATPQQLERVSNLRNSIVHNKNVGEIVVVEGRLKYEIQQETKAHEIGLAECLNDISNLSLDIYYGVCRRLNIDKRNKIYKKNNELYATFRDIFRMQD